MNNALLNTQNFNLASLIPQSALAAMTGIADAADKSFGSGDVYTLGFRGREFSLRGNGTEVALPNKQVDFYLVAMRPNDHFVFYDTSFDESESGVQGNMLTRDVLASDPKEFIPTGQWKSRSRKRRCVIMLANDTDKRLVIADFGAKSVYQPTEINAGLFNLSKLQRQIASIRNANPNIFSFRFTLQMSFTRDSVPVVQFSFMDQLTRAEPVRQTPPNVVSYIAEQFANGEVERLLNLWFDDEPTPVPQVQQAPVAPVAPVAPQVAPQVAPVAPVAPVQVDDLEEF